MLVYHAAITAAEDYLERRAPHRQGHFERIVGLRAQGLVIGGGAGPARRAPSALCGVPGAGRLAFGGFFEEGTTLALLKTADSAEASGWLAATGFWNTETLTARPFLYAL